MNDYLLQSKKKNANDVEQLQLNKKESLDHDNSMPQIIVLRNQNKASTTARLLGVEAQAKIAVIFNNMCVILLLNLLSFGTIVSTFVNVRWFLMAESEKYLYWVNLLFIEKMPANPQSQNSNTYFFWMFSFYYGGCNKDDLTNDDPVNFCTGLIPYYYGGIVGTIIISLGLIIHIIHIWKLARMTTKRTSNQIKGFHPLNITYLIIFLYTAAFVYWMLASTCLFVDNAERKILFSQFGSSFYCYIGAFFFFIILTLWFRKIYKKGVRKIRVHSLLNAEKKYMNDFGSVFDEVSGRECE